jgi:hypothetical protein
MTYPNRSTAVPGCADNKVLTAPETPKGGE